MVHRWTRDRQGNLKVNFSPYSRLIVFRRKGGGYAFSVENRTVSLGFQTEHEARIAGERACGWDGVSHARIDGQDGARKDTTE
jgi:hypothetical protein